MKNIKFMYLYLLNLRGYYRVQIRIHEIDFFFFTRLNLKLINITINYKSLFMSHGAPKFLSVPLSLLRNSIQARDWRRQRSVKITNPILQA